MRETHTQSELSTNPYDYSSVTHLLNPGHLQDFENAQSDEEKLDAVVQQLVISTTGLKANFLLLDHLKSDKRFAEKIPKIEAKIAAAIPVVQTLLDWCIAHDVNPLTYSNRPEGPMPQTIDELIIALTPNTETK